MKRSSYEGEYLILNIDFMFGFTLAILLFTTAENVVSNGIFKGIHSMINFCLLIPSFLAVFHTEWDV